MSRPTLIILAIVLSLGATEAMAWWWMHPAPAGLGQPVLCYRPQVGRARRAHPLVAKDAPPNSESERGASISSIQNPSSTYTPLPEIYAKSAPMLRCSSGQVFHVKLDPDISLHLAFFEWNASDTGSVLEAFRHMPEACLGSLGMTLVSIEPTIPYQVGTETLIFDHSIFREPGSMGNTASTISPLVHAFRAVWVSNLPAANVRQGLYGDTFDHNLRTIRFKSALTRFRPAHARVAQGAVRGTSSGDDAWNAFQSAMLADLTFSPGT